MTGIAKADTNYFGSGDERQTASSTEPTPDGEPVYLDTHLVDIAYDKNRNKLGEGAFATVYEGKYRGQPCAVKVFKENVIKDKDDLVYLCGLKCPNIVKIHGLWIDPFKGRNALSIVMELCDTSLYEYIKSHEARGIPRSDKLKILHDVTNAMIYLHSEHIVHGDLRSPNVLLVNTRSREGPSNDQPQITAKVADFGLTQLIDPKTITHYTTTFADEDYLPPETIDEEQFKGRKHVRLTFSVDVFCFGPLAIELACMEFPKPVAKVEHKKGQVVRVLDEIERRERYLKKIDYAERMYTDLIVKQCLADRPEERGSFLSLQLTIEAFQKKMKKCTEHELLENAQAKIIDMRKKMEEDATTLSELEVKLGQQEEEIKRIQENLQLKVAESDRCNREAVDAKNQLTEIKKKADEFEHSLHSVEEEKLNLSARLRKMEESEAEIKRVADQQKARLKEEEEKLRAAEDEKTSLSTRLMKTEESLKDYENENISLKLKQTEKDTELKKVEQQLLRTVQVPSLAGVPHLDPGDKDEAVDKEKLLSQVEDLQRQLKEKEEELSELRIERDRLKEQYERKREENYNFEDTQMTLIQRIDELKRNTNPMLPAKVGTYQLEEQNVPPGWLKGEEEKLRAAEEEKTKLNAKLLETEKSLEDTKEIQSQLREDKDKLRRDNYELRESLEMYLNYSEQKDRAIKTLQDERKKYIQSLQAKEEEQKELKRRMNKQIKCFRQKEIEWKAEIENITRTFEPGLSILQTNQAELERKVANSEEVICQKEQEIVALKRSKDTLSVEVQEKERELAELKKKLEAEIASREENQQRIKEYKATSEKMERLAGTLQSELSELTQLLTEQEASATAKQKELKEMLEVANKEKIAFAEQMEQEERIQTELRKQLDKQGEQQENGVFEPDKLTEKIHYLRIELMKESVRSTELQARLDNANRSMKREISGLKGEISGLKGEISGLKGEISHLEEENKQLKVAKRRFDLEKANFEEDNKMLSERCDSYKVERDRMCEEKENLLAKLDQLKKRIETLEDQMCQLIAEKASLKDDDRWRNDSSELKIECDRSKNELLRLNQERHSLLTQQQELERERDKWMKGCKAMKELSSQRMVSSSSEEPVDLEDLERQEDRKRKVVQMQTDIDQLKELAGSMAGGPDSVDPNMSSNSDSSL